MKKHIFLIEPELSGHHSSYLLHFTNILLEKGYKVTVFSTEKVDKVEGALYKKIIYIPPFNLPSNQLKKKLYVLINLFISIYNLFFLRWGIRVDKKAYLFFCCIDEYMHDLMPVFVFNLFVSRDFSALLLSFSGRDFLLLNRLNILDSKYLKYVGCLCDIIPDELIRFERKVIRFPDFSDESKPNLKHRLIKDILDKSKGRKVISLLGSISLRKGYKTFINTIEYLPKHEYFFVIAGKSERSDRLYIQGALSKYGNVYFYSNSIPSEAEFNALVYISDIIYAAYINFRESSNMLAKASMFKKPIIVSKGYYMEKIVDRYNIGISIDQESPIECSLAIEELKANSCAENGFDSYFRDNKVKKLNECFERCLP